MGRRVRETRETLGLRQDELALAAGVSTRLVHQIESGKATSRLDGIVAVLATLGLTVEVVGRSPRRSSATGSRSFDG